MRSTITQMEIEKRDDSMELNSLTGCMQKKLGKDNLKKSNVGYWPSLTGEDVSKAEDFTCDVPFAKADKARQIVYGIVYEPDVADAQNDEANAEEIEKAAHDFLANSRIIKLMHKGRKVSAEVIESYIAPDDLTIGEQSIKKGSWVIATHVSDAKIWKAIVDGELTGFSMAGKARAEEAA